MEKCAIGLSVCVLLASASGAAGALKEWKNTANGDWRDAAKWEGGVPGLTDNAAFPAGFLLAYTVRLTGRESISRMDNFGKLTMDLNGKKLQLTGATSLVNSGAADLTLKDGTVAASGNVNIQAPLELDAARLKVSGTLTNWSDIDVHRNPAVGRARSALETSTTIIGPAAAAQQTGNVRLREGAIWRSTGNILIGQVSPGLVTGKGNVIVDRNAKLNAKGKDILVDDGSVLKAGKDQVLGNTKRISVKAGNVTVKGLLLTESAIGDRRKADYDIENLFFMHGDGTLQLGIAGTDVASYDSLRIFGHSQIEGALDVNFTDGYVPVPGDRFTVFRSSTMSGAFAGMSDGSIVNVDGYDFRVRYHSGSPMSSVTLRAVPTPGAAALTAAACLGCVVRRRRVQ